MRPLTRLRLRLTAWYVGTFAAITLALGGLLFAAISRQVADRLDRSVLRTTIAAAEMIRTHRVAALQLAARPPLIDRWVYVLDAAGRPLRPDTASHWVRDAARSALRDRTFATSVYLGAERSLHLAAARVRATPGAAPLVVVTAADNQELEDAYTGLIVAFALAALAGLGLVTAGGVLVARKSSAPVERAFEQMRQFVADAAHELRTPVAVIRAEADVALARMETEGDAAGAPAALPGQAALQRVVRECEALGRVVDDLLTLARADAGEQPRALHPVALGDVALDAAHAAAALAARRGVTLDLGTCDEGIVLGDPSLLRRLLIILLDNAVKYTPAGGHVSLAVHDDPGAVRAVVRDDGPGIAPAERERVFDRFYRSASGGRDRPSGAGLGLPIARWIGMVHGAGIDIATAEPHGTVVTVRLPAAPGTLSPP